MPKLLTRLNVIETEDDRRQFVEAVYATQECGKIIGGGTCPQPFEIELNEPWKSAPELLASLREFVAHLESHATYGINAAEAAMLRRADEAIAKACGS